MRKWQSYSAFRFLSSLKLAVLSILSLACILAVATVFESLYGMRGAHVLVYGQVWFYGVLMLLGTNVFCAALSRYPWKKRQTGFVITHLGILILLFGSWLTMEYGVDGNLPVVEGQQDSEVILNDLEFVVSDPEGGQSEAFPIYDTAVRKDGRLLEVGLPGSDKLVVSSFLPRAKMERVVEKSPTGLGVPAVHVEVFNDRFAVDEWILANDPDGPSEVSLGPAVLSLQKFWTEAQEGKFVSGESPAMTTARKTKGVVVVQIQGKEFRVDIDEGLKAWLPIGGTGFSVHVVRYLPYAVVEKNQLVNRGTDPVNPTVQVRIKDTAGVEEEHTLFANFPDFATLHKQGKPENQREFGVHFRMIASQGAGAPAARGKLLFAQTADGTRLLYRILGKDSRFLSQGEVAVDRIVPTGWMDLRFRVKDWIPAAVQSDRPRYIERMQGSENFPTAIELTREGPAPVRDRRWIVEGGSTAVSVGDRILEASLSRSRLSLPFAIHLDKFTLGTDPGTSKAASYESDVEVKDAANPKAPKAHISMNEPLVYGGYTFYQASYQIREGQPPLSVFSVNFDPGRWVKYLGSLVMVFGILSMFYLNPHYWDILLGRKRA